MEYYTIEMAIQNLSSPDPEIRKGTAHWIGTLNDIRAIEPLITALDDEDFDVRAYAALSLGTLKTAQAVEPLLHRLLNDDNVHVKAACIGALGELGDKRAISALENTLDTNVTLRGKAIIALGEIGWTPIGTKALGYLQDDTQSESVYFASIVVVGKLKLEAATKIIEKFLKRDDLDLVNPALLTLAEIGTESAKNAIENNLPYLSEFDQKIANRFLEKIR